MDHFFVIAAILAVAVLAAIGAVTARRNEVIGTRAMRWTLGFLIAGPALAILFIVLGLSVESSGSTVAFGFVTMAAAAIAVVVCGIAAAITMIVGVITQRGRRRRSLGVIVSRQRF